MVDAVHDVVGRQLAPVHRRLVVPAHTLPELEDIRRLVGLAPRLGQVALARERAGARVRPRLVLEQGAVGEAQRDMGLVGDGLERIEVRRVPGAERERPATLRGLAARMRRSDGRPGERDAAELQDVATAEIHGDPSPWFGVRRARQGLSAITARARSNTSIVSSTSVSVWASET